MPHTAPAVPSGSAAVPHSAPAVSRGAPAVPPLLQLCPTENSPAAKPWMARQGSGAGQGHAGEDLQPLRDAKAQGDGLGVAVPSTQTPFPFPSLQLQQLQLRLRRCTCCPAARCLAYCFCGFRKLLGGEQGNASHSIPVNLNNYLLKHPARSPLHYVCSNPPALAAITAVLIGTTSITSFRFRTLAQGLYLSVWSIAYIFNLSIISQDLGLSAAEVLCSMGKVKSLKQGHVYGLS